MIIFNNTSAKIKTKSADVLLKMIMSLTELRIAQPCSQNEWTLAFYFCCPNLRGALVSDGPASGPALLCMYLLIPSLNPCDIHTQHT